jgi:hypothetical protein
MPIAGRKLSRDGLPTTVGVHLRKGRMKDGGPALALAMQIPTVLLARTLGWEQPARRASHRRREGGA